MAVANSLHYAATLFLLALRLSMAHECNGYDEEWNECPDLKPCHTCSPVDCAFTTWGSWYEGGGCTGLMFRQRMIEVQNNECGLPCKGAKIESTEKVSKECLLDKQDCAIGEWTQWSACETSKSQRYRTRAVLSNPSNGGKACFNHTEETMPCSGPTAIHCEFGDWMSWTTCSAKCGDGRHTRMRKVAVEAKNGGTPCSGETLQTKRCASELPCPSQDCKLGDWEAWSTCDLSYHPQRYRQRQVIQTAEGDGKACSAELKQTAGCPAPAAVDCELSEWSAWATCDKTCDGGQTYRSRYLKKPMSNNGLCAAASLREAAACNTPLCAKPPGDCEVGTWGEWSECSAKCGQGSKTRTRKVTKMADAGGKGCTESLEELTSCSSVDCDMTDCQWSNWYDWSACSTSCGGGVKRRSRVVAVAPRNGGEYCDEKTMEEAIPCNRDSCEAACVDAQWGEWFSWSECSSSCSSGFRSRRRDVKTDPNECGKALSGVREEYEACQDLPPCIKPIDCALSDWTEWSSCNSTCYGTRERNRFIQVYAQGTGKACEASAVKEVTSCNPVAGMAPTGACAVPVQDALLSEWSEWGECTRSCGGGQMTKTRRMLTKPANGGRTAEEPLAITAPCNQQHCGPVEPCVDCTWGEWGEWSDCMKCGGQRERHRTITQMPNFCGKQCDLVSAKEVSNCTSQCEEQLFCAWTKWSDSSGCDAGCGLSTTMRNRALGLVRAPEGVLFEGTGGVRCSGTQLKVETCPNAKPCKEPCVPRDGQFSAWSEWTTPTCVGLCERERNIAVVSNECGSPAVGPLMETKRCEAACDEAMPCILSTWGAWSACTDPSGQSYRVRSVTQMPTLNGAPCEGSLNETKACSLPCATQPCVLATWSEWGACARSCGGGWQTRSRRIMEHARCGGEACNQNLEEMRMCNEVACATNEVDCEFSEWNAWSGYGLDGQRYRERTVETLADGGKPCDGTLLETESLPTQVPVDCKVSAWTAWEECDVSCGGGQQHRQRQVHTFSANGGLPCNESLMETQGCNAHACNVEDCELGDWSAWDTCSATCGVGQQRRTRKIARGRGADGGIGCSAPLSEIASCAGSTPCESTDCAWGLWSEWSTCTCTCGGGQRSRDRHIAKAPQHGGKACLAGPDHHREVIEPCNTQPCKEEKCVDGKWSEWNEWSPCSMSCGGGVTYRTRKVAIMATECGSPPEGNDREEEFCNSDVSCEESIDCAFGDWGVWSDCSSSCDGIKRRSRRIATYGRGEGKFCIGGLKETAPCEVLLEGTCEEKPAVDCQFSEWQPWGECSAHCGGGEQTRSRTLLTEPLRGGHACEGGLSEVQECSRESCAHDPKDCKLGEWQEWSACDKCDGERKRFRAVIQYAEDGGLNCDLQATEELGKCTSHCHDIQYCEWSEWKEWGLCSSQCGEGRRSRRRYLTIEQKEPSSIFDLEGSAARKYEELRQRRQYLESYRVQGPVLAFSGGCFCFLLAFAAIRTMAGVSQRRRLLLVGSRQPLQANTAYDHLPSLE